MFGDEENMKSGELIKLIKSRRSIRQYKKRTIPKGQIIKILEAGRWSPSAHNAQPWRFIVVTKPQVIKKLSKVLVNKSRNLLTGFDIVLRKTAEIVSNAPVIVAVYNSGELSNRMKKFDEPYFSITKMSELQSIAASIENMLLMAHARNLGAAWLTAPLFCEDEIKSFLNIKGYLVALVTFGYPNQYGTKSDRKPLKNLVKFH